jgi:ribosome-binding protein aMBF1 (putative translation factor)
MTRKHQMASFPRLRQYRVELGWEMTDLAAKLQNSPRISSLYNLERGRSIRLVSVRRVFYVLNKAYHGELSFESEVFLD